MSLWDNWSFQLFILWRKHVLIFLKGLEFIRLVESRDGMEWDGIIGLGAPYPGKHQSLWEHNLGLKIGKKYSSL